MKVHAKAAFKEGRFLAEAGRDYEVPDEVGGYLVRNGWCEKLPADHAGECEAVALESCDPNAPAPAENVTLTVDDIAVGMSGG